MLTVTSIFEVLMLCAFGISWPLNVAKAWKSRTAKGISLPFYLLIWIGYICGIIGKYIAIYYSIHILGIAQNWTEVVKWYVMFFYVLNLLMVSAGIIVYFRNKRLDKLAN